MPFYIGIDRTVLAREVGIRRHGAVFHYEIFRIIPAFFLTKTMGLAGFWISMCVELNIRGLLFLWRLHSGKWLNVRMKVDNIETN